MPEIKSGMCVASEIYLSLKKSGISLESGDVLVVAQKVISKSEGRTVNLRSVNPSARAVEIAREVDKDPRLVEVILSQTKRVVRKGRVSTGQGKTDSGDRLRNDNGKCGRGSFKHRK